MWSSTAITRPTGPQQALLSAPELQALLYGEARPVLAQGLASSSQPSRTLWPAQAPIVSGPSAQDNQILAALSPTEHASLVPHLEHMSLASGQVIGQPGHALQHVYFPLDCSVSWVSHTADGESAELALVGSDGLIGVPLVLGGLPMQHTVQVQCGGQALRMGADAFLRTLGNQPRLQKLVLLFVQWQMVQMAQSIVCSRHHAVSERLSHWLLSHAQAARRMELHVTHETISHMLGVRRESVTQAAGRFQAAGWLGNSRGKITLKNPDQLRSMACECQARSQAESKRYLQQLARASEAPHGNAQGNGQAHESGHGHGQDFGAITALAPLKADLSPYGLSPADADETPAEDALQKYIDAYDFAPVGFVTIDAQGKILQTNLAGAILLDIQRSQCQHQSFADFLDGESQAPFARFHHEVLGGQCRRHCVVQLRPTAHRSALHVRIDATVDEWGVENRMVLIDVSEQAVQDASLNRPWSVTRKDAGASPTVWRS